MLNSENKIIHLNSCDSTNNYAKELLAKSEPTEGTVIITDKQTNGKGQFGNNWISKDYKNLTFSIILKPTFLKPIQQFYLSKIISLASIQTLNEFTDEEFKIKWPNDIYYKNKKIAGILIENTITREKIIDSIIGIGININQTFENELNFAISLAQILQTEINKEKILLLLLKNYQKFYLLLKNNKIKIIDSLYSKSLLGIDKKRKFINSTTKEEFYATIKGVNTIGQLHLLTNGQNEFYNLKEIKWII